MPNPGSDGELPEESPRYISGEELVDAAVIPGEPEEVVAEEKERKYHDVIVEAFRRHHIREGERADWLEFTKDELADIGQQYDLTSRNLPDLVYTYRARKDLPPEITSSGHWAIVAAGRGRYAFQRLRNPPRFDINFSAYKLINIYNALPDLVERLLRNDEQSLLTRLLYNRLVDIFTGLTCFHIQNHYRSQINVGRGGVARRSEVEVDALYVGVDQRGALYAIPVEAKSAGAQEQINRTQLSQAAKLCRQEFPQLGRRIIATKLLSDGTIGMAEFTDGEDPDDFALENVSHFRLIRRGDSEEPLHAAAGRQPDRGRSRGGKHRRVREAPPVEQGSLDLEP